MNWYKTAQQNRKKYLENLAKKEFGTTSSISLAGYLLTDGTMLNFSKGGYQRDYDHRQISGIGEGEAIKEQYTLGMYEFMKETKAIRVNAHSESLGLHIMSPPTIEQLSIINKNLKYFPEFYIDIQDSKGDIIEHKEYNYPNSREVTAYWFNIQNIYTGDITNEYKYPTEIYRAYNEYYGSDTSPEDIDTMRDNEVSMVASMSLPGGKEEFMELVKRHNNELV